MTIKNRLPDLLPFEAIRVTDEGHLFEQIEYSDGSTSTKPRYVPNKAPVLSVEGITGQVDGEAYTFEQGVDYEVIDTNDDGRLDTIDFSVGGNSPDPNTTFVIDYTCRSIISRYVESYQDELDRVGNDIQEVIDSHYVDEASNTGYIDNFEDEEVVEYEIQSGQRSQVSVQNNRSEIGRWALQLDTNTSFSTRIASDSGLDRYPRRGDTFVYYTYLTDTDDVSTFDFLWSQSPRGTDNYYRVQIDAEADTVSIHKSGGNKRDSSSVSLDQYLDSWIRVEVSVEEIGSVTATFIDSDRNTFGSASITDTEFSDGGIRWQAGNAVTSSSVYFDGAEVIQRDSTDLDNIGSLFGELGRRRGRSDEDYVTFLRSVVQSFSGRGTIDGIRFAVSSGFSTDEDLFTIEEDFQNNSYTVSIAQPFPPHSISTVTDLAELADPSGVNFERIRYIIDDDEAAVDDSVSVTSAFLSSDSVLVDDASVTVDDGTSQILDQSGFDDDTLLATNGASEFRWGELETSTTQASANEWGGSDWNGTNWTDGPTLDAEATGQTWNFSQWVTLNELQRQSTDDFGSSDAVSVDTTVRATTDGAGSDETTAVSTSSVAWGDDWEVANWGGPFGA